MLIMEDAATLPAFYHPWQDVEFRQSSGLVTEADLSFPNERVAVFCDGSHHARPEQKAKDAAINAKLEAVGIRAVQIPGTKIKFELPKAIAGVKELLG
jgi:very-short-patch-repair endonuclease